MTQLRAGEFRLTKVIHEARDLLLAMKSHRCELQKCHADMPSALKALKADILKTINAVIKKEKELKEEMQAATETANKMEGHFHWKAAVLFLYGEDGVSQCIQHMREAQLINQEIETCTSPA